MYAEIICSVVPAARAKDPSATPSIARLSSLGTHLQTDVVGIVSQDGARPDAITGPTDRIRVQVRFASYRHFAE